MTPVNTSSTTTTLALPPPSTSSPQTAINKSAPPPPTLMPYTPMSLFDAPAPSPPTPRLLTPPSTPPSTMKTTASSSSAYQTSCIVVDTGHTNNSKKATIAVKIRVIRQTEDQKAIHVIEERERYSAQYYNYKDQWTNCKKDYNSRTSFTDINKERDRIDELEKRKEEARKKWAFYD